MSIADMQTSRSYADRHSSIGARIELLLADREMSGGTSPNSWCHLRAFDTKIDHYQVLLEERTGTDTP